jgi:glutamate synthase domain-containing protein 3
VNKRKRGGKPTVDESEKIVAKDGINVIPKNLSMEKNVAKIDAYGVYYRNLNTLLRRLDGNGIEKIELRNVYGQRYIGTDLDGHISIDVYGTPGNDLGALMRGPKITVHGNVQDGCGNTMDHGQIVVHGRAGDLVGHSMRGGKIFIRDDAGYRVGIHMKEYRDKRPLIVIGGTAQDFLGEYMAGGVLVVLGLNLNEGKHHNARFVGTGMHGGIIYIRGEVHHLGKEVEVVDLEEDDRLLLRSLVDEFCSHFGFDADKILDYKFSKLIPISHRPYGGLYAY